MYFTAFAFSMLSPTPRPCGQTLSWCLEQPNYEDQPQKNVTRSSAREGARGVRW